MIKEPAPFDRHWYSHKFKGPGVRYEVGVCCRTGYIVWVNGPFAAGGWPDLEIFKEDMINYLDAGERVIADNGYPTGGLYTIIPKTVDVHDKRIHSLVRARHEIVNRRLKQFQVLGERFRGGLDNHGIIFWAVAVITQLALKHESIPFHPVDLL